MLMEDPRDTIIDLLRRSSDFYSFLQFIYILGQQNHNYDVILKCKQNTIENSRNLQNRNRSLFLDDDEALRG